MLPRLLRLEVQPELRVQSQGLELQPEFPAPNSFRIWVLTSVLVDFVVIYSTKALINFGICLFLFSILLNFMADFDVILFAVPITLPKIS